MDMITENPAPELFTTFERLENCHRVKVTEDNIHVIAKHFGWKVDYRYDIPRLYPQLHGPIEVGDWVDHRGSRWNPEPLKQGWKPAGTYTEVEP